MSSAFKCLLPRFSSNLLPILLILFIKISYAWLPDASTKLINHLNKIHSITFKGANASSTNHFTVLHQDKDTILLGGRNRIYNLSLFDFTERKESGIFWPSSEAHGQLCVLKGKFEDDCQNYIRIMFETGPDQFVVCGTNSYKPLCRIFMKKNETLVVAREMEGIGMCPYDAESNSTAIYTNGHLFSATVADFSGVDSLIYRAPLRTELADLRQLNAPNFVSSVMYGDYIYFFFREVAVEYMNCGKALYSRVARVCKHDKGGPHQSRDRWTTFLKARLNCSVPGEYPFYFEEIQATSDIIEGKYGGTNSMKIIYSTHTTPTNAIGGSALCIFKMEDIEAAFLGTFKYQEGINSNWLPFPDSRVPTPRPGQCMQDSRLLPDQNVNFIKMHPLMDEMVPAFNMNPLLIRVSMHYRFTAVTVDAQVRTVTDDTFDVIYVGTDDGRILKIVNIPLDDTSKAIVISDNEIFPKNMPVKQLKLAPGYGKVVAVTKQVVKLVTLNHCKSISRCSDCIELRDPHCAWDSLTGVCVSVDAVVSFRYLLQDVRHGDISLCNVQPIDSAPGSAKEFDTNAIDTNSLEDKEPQDSLLLLDDDSTDCNEVGCVSQSKLTLYTSVYLYIFVIVASISGLVIGFAAGYLVSRKLHANATNPSAFIEQHNHLDRLTVNQNSFLAPRNKTVNLDVLNVSAESLPPKKDNLGSLKNLNITNEGTLQKIKKTYL